MFTSFMFIKFTLTIAFEHNKLAHVTGLACDGQAYDLKSVQSEILLNQHLINTFVENFLCAGPYARHWDEATF